MDDAGEERTPRNRKTAAPAPAVRGTAILSTLAHANLAALRTTGVLIAQLKGIAAQVALPSARYADLFAGMSTSRVFAQDSSLNRIASANIAVLTLTRNPAWLEATRGLSKSLETHHASVLLEVLEDFHTSGVVAQATERWASQHADLLANAKFQLPALSRTLLPGVARPPATRCSLANL